MKNLQIIHRSNQTYDAALLLVQRLDAGLRTGTLHLRRQGRLLRTLDEAVNAVLADELVIDQQAAEMVRAA